DNATDERGKGRQMLGQAAAGLARIPFFPGLMYGTIAPKVVTHRIHLLIRWILQRVYTMRQPLLSVYIKMSYKSVRWRSARLRSLLYDYQTVTLTCPVFHRLSLSEGTPPQSVHRRCISLTTRGRLDCACARCHCASVVWSDRAHPMRKTTPDTPRGSRSKRTTNNDLASIGNRSCPLTLRRIPWPPKPGNLPHLITCGWGPGHSFTSFFSRLLLCALIWRVVILHLTWLKRRVTA